MAFSATETTQIFQMFGVPETGTVTVVHHMVSLWGPYAENYDLSGVVTALTARITAINANASALVMAQGVLTAYYTTVGDNSQVRITADGSTTGVLADDKAELEYYRTKLSNILGFFCPRGGYTQELRDRYGRNGNSVVRW